MDKQKVSTQCQVRRCSQCQGDTEFYCRMCEHDLCLQCKERHVIDLHTKHHDVVIFREMFKCVPFQEICARHPYAKYRFLCDQCKYPVCVSCKEHRTHALMDITKAYQAKRQQHTNTIKNIRSTTLYNCSILLTRFQTYIQTCPQQISHRQSQMSTKAQRLKDMIDTVVCDVKTRNRGFLIARKQEMRKMIEQLVHTQDYEDKYEQTANRTVQYLVFIKTSCIPQIWDALNLPQHHLLSLTEGFNMKGTIQFLSEIPSIQMSTGKRQVRKGGTVKLMFTPVFYMSVCVTGVSSVLHISGVTLDRVWVSDDRHNLILTDTTGGTIHRVTDISKLLGIHTVTSSSELIYIDSDYNINILSLDNKAATTLVEVSTSQWRPQCMYCSPSTGDLMFGMYNTYTDTGKITRYNDTAEHILTIPRGRRRKTLYSDPRYITENRNGDIIVSDIGRNAVVVTERGGRHRFTYTGPPSRSSLLTEREGRRRFSDLKPPLKLSPRGICTDALSHILVCDFATDTIQMIDQDGHFLSLLLTQQHGINEPYSLNYDDKSHRLWIGSRNNTLSVYTCRYM